MPASSAHAGCERPPARERGAARTAAARLLRHDVNTHDMFLATMRQAAISERNHRQRTGQGEPWSQHRAAPAGMARAAIGECCAASRPYPLRPRSASAAPRTAPSREAGVRGRSASGISRSASLRSSQCEWSQLAVRVITARTASGYGSHCEALRRTPTRTAVTGRTHCGLAVRGSRLALRPASAAKNLRTPSCVGCSYCVGCSPAPS